MRTGINHDHRVEGKLREDLGLHPGASEAKVLEALLHRLELLEKRVNFLEKNTIKHSDFEELDEN